GPPSLGGWRHQTAREATDEERSLLRGHELGVADGGHDDSTRRARSTRSPRSARRCSPGTRTTCTRSWTRAWPRKRSTPCRPNQPGRQRTASACCSPGQRKTVNLPQDSLPRGSRPRLARSSQARERTRRCGWTRVWNRGTFFYPAGGVCWSLSLLSIPKGRFGAF
ncbi:unnamed protein product, partial [Ectocarpus sp. 12 AP-2014]